MSVSNPLSGYALRVAVSECRLFKGALRSVLRRVVTDDGACVEQKQKTPRVQMMTHHTYPFLRTVSLAAETMPAAFWKERP